MGWPASWSTLAAASRALSFLSWVAFFFALGAAFFALGVAGVFACFLTSGVAALVALPGKRRLLPVAAASVPAGSVTATSVMGVLVSVGGPLTSAGWCVFFLLGMSDFPKGLVKWPRRPTRRGTRTGQLPHPC